MEGTKYFSIAWTDVTGSRMLLKLCIVYVVLAQLLNSVSACTCSWGASDQRQICDASYAFRAVVEEEIPQTPEIPDWARDEPDVNPDNFIYFYKYRVKVEEVFKKPTSVHVSGTIIVQTPRMPGMCVLTLPVGNEVLLTGFGDGNTAWDANACSWVQMWEEVTSDSKMMLRKGIESIDCSAIARPRWSG
ncbi:hypothetical protein ACJMK2_024221 [Sinanodonta woodiana]|uniref:NTR domain-containing protein n=1 Tax=Sinanodonta woodiana TaxID=1069815 RepID=A0ABD3T6Q8_SINWO